MNGQGSPTPTTTTDWHRPILDTSFTAINNLNCCTYHIQHLTTHGQFNIDKEHVDNTGCVVGRALDIIGQATTNWVVRPGGGGGRLPNIT